jgi:hypothetical protein
VNRAHGATVAPTGDGRPRACDGSVKCHSGNARARPCVMRAHGGRNDGAPA